MTQFGKWTLTSPSGEVISVDVSKLTWAHEVIEVASCDNPNAPVLREYTGRSTITLDIFRDP